MSATSNITLVMLLEETKRIRGYMEKHYPEMVNQRKITPFERDHRLACNQKLIELLTEALHNKKFNGPKLMEILNKQP